MGSWNPDNAYISAEPSRARNCASVIAEGSTTAATRSDNCSAPQVAGPCLKLAALRHFLDRGSAQGIAALGDRFVEKPIGKRADHKHIDRHATRRHAKYGHIPWITTKLTDIVLHPIQRHDHIKEAKTRWGRIQSRMGKEADWTESIIKGNHNNPMLRHNLARDLARTAAKPTPVNPNHHWLLGGLLLPSPNI